LFQRSYIKLLNQKEYDNDFALTDEQLENYRKTQYEEQRNLIYVALTRSKKYLLISATKHENDDISPLNEILEANLDNNFFNNTKEHDLEIEENGDNHSDSIPINLSYTSLKVYEDCPSKFKFKSCYNFCDPISDYKGRGEAIHLVLECFLKNTDPGYEIEQYVDKYFLLPYAPKSKMQNFKSNVLKDFKNILNSNYFGNSNEKQVEYSIEIPIEVEDVDVLINGNIDFLNDNKIIDYKTSGVNVNEALNTDQLVIYYKGYKETTQKSLSEGYILDFENNKLIGPRALNEEEWKKIEEKIISATKEIKNDKFSCNINKCENCPYSKICHKNNK